MPETIASCSSATARHTGEVSALPTRLSSRDVTGAAYGLLLGGAWGNGLNRMLRPPGFPRGQVVDFLAIRVPEFFPIGPDLARFNFADVAILLGFAVLLRSLSRET